MFFDGGPSKKAVSLGGKSKKEDRQAVLARAAREREERQRQRERLKAAVRVQARCRTYTDMRRLRTMQRAAFDAEIAAHVSSAVPASELTRLISRLLCFHQSSVSEDSTRRRRLLSAVTASAAASSLEENVCARMCATEVGAKCWQHQIRCATPPPRHAPSRHTRRAHPCRQSSHPADAAAVSSSWGCLRSLSPPKVTARAPLIPPPPRAPPRRPS